MIMGPADGGSTINKELLGLARLLEGWFIDRENKGLEGSNQGWLEYLYGVVLSKGKTEEDAKRWFMKSVRLFPFNWGCWLELSELLNNVEEVSHYSIDSSWVIDNEIQAPKNPPRTPPKSNDSNILRLRKPRTRSNNRDDPQRPRRARSRLPREPIPKNTTRLIILSLKRFAPFLPSPRQTPKI